MPENHQKYVESPLERALLYLDKFNWPLFPRPGGRNIAGSHGWKDASRDYDQITAWWGKYPDALIAMPTGDASGVVVLDIDRKHGVDGLDTLADIGRSQLPDTPMVHTPSGGLHLYFNINPNVSIGFVQGKDGLGPGLDVLGAGTSVCLPTPGYGYRWDPLIHPGSCAFRKAPSWFARRKKPGDNNGHSGGRLDAGEILARACRRIREAGNGQRHAILNREAFIIGCIVSRGELSESTARHELEAATVGIGDNKKSARDLADAFRAGLRKGGRG